MDSFSFPQDPMDLSKIENKLESGVYKSVAQFEADFRLMWDNCAEFNGDDSGSRFLRFPLNLTTYVFR